MDPAVMSIRRIELSKNHDRVQPASEKNTGRAVLSWYFKIHMQPQETCGRADGWSVTDRPSR